MILETSYLVSVHVRGINYLQIVLAVGDFMFVGFEDTNLNHFYEAKRD